jgi:hypothetical protein
MAVNAVQILNEMVDVLGVLGQKIQGHVLQVNLLKEQVIQAGSPAEIPDELAGKFRAAIEQIKGFTEQLQ